MTKKETELERMLRDLGRLAEALQAVVDAGTKLQDAADKDPAAPSQLGLDWRTAGDPDKPH